MTQVPTYDSMMNPLLEAMRNLGGSGTIEEIYAEVAKILALSDQQLELLHDPERSSQTEIEYRLAWTRTYLKKYGLLENSQRGVWALTPEGRKLERVNEKKVVRFVREQDKKQRAEEEHIQPETADSWRDELMAILLEMDPPAFERLFQRILREAGFIQVQVTGRSGDGGIDGTGILRMGGFLSFRVLFQCKRWKGSVGAGVVRDFRGAMVGRADKGLLVSTGNFTTDAVREATRDGAPAIDLIDGDQLIDKLKEFGLGLRTEQVVNEKVAVNRDWYLSL
ncbi:MAG: restriction endonuclease [Anaerolineae bacterium]|nr:restriction endonuclease [Anaerolineae bacterium]